MGPRLSLSLLLSPDAGFILLLLHTFLVRNADFLAVAQFWKVAADNLLVAGEWLPLILELLTEHFHIFAIADAYLHRRAHGLAVVMQIDGILVTNLNNGVLRQGEDVTAFNLDHAVSVHSGTHTGVLVGQVDLGPQGAALDVQGPRGP